MALPKRKSRPITVDGVSYRWQFSDRYRSETSDHSIAIVVQLETGEGSKIVCAGRCPTREIFLEPAQIVRPSMVSAIIRFAIENGWCPDNESFRIDNVESFFTD